MRNNLSAIGSTTLSGLSNVLIQLLAAKVLHTEEYARFAIAAATLLFFVGLSRALIGQTDLIRGERSGDDGVVAAAYSLALVCGILGLPIALTNVILGGDGLLAVGMALIVSPVFILQDAARFRSFRLTRAHVALVSDLATTVLPLGLLVIFADSWSTSTSLILMWGVTTGVGFAIAAASLRYLVSPRYAAKWFNANSDVVLPGGIEFLLQSTVPYMLNWVVLALGGAGALAGFRIVQLIFGTLGSLAQGLSAFELPQIANEPTRGTIQRLLNRNALMLGVPALLIFVLVRYLPDETGATLFGSSWYGVSPFLIAGGIHGLVNALSITNFQILRILGESRYSLSIRTITVVLTPAAAFVGGITLGAAGIAWGLAAVASLGYSLRLARVVSRSKALGGV